MKELSFFITAVMLAVLSTTSYAQMHDNSEMDATKTETFKVWGNCGMCKTRIEKAAKIEGVSKADRNAETKLLTVVYDTLKVSRDTIQKEIAAVGHDTEEFKADDKAYANLPGCCRYERDK